MSKYIVLDELTLGIVSQGIPDMMDVLAAKIGGHNWKNGAVSTFGGKVRPATAADFTTFRVMLPKDFVAAPGPTDAQPPSFYEAEAEAYERAQRWEEAARNWSTASSVCLGRMRAMRYMEREAFCRRKLIETNFGG